MKIFSQSNEKRPIPEEEIRFRDIMMANNIEWRKATEEEDRKGHFDCVIKNKKNQEIKIEIKGRKKINRKDNHYQNSIIWLELVGITGYPGWLKGKSDFIAFEMTRYVFEIYSTKQLLNLVLKQVDLKTFVKRPEESIMKLYSRAGRKDVICGVPIEIIRKLNHKTVSI